MNTAAAHCYTTICVCVYVLNSAMKFVPLIRAAGCVTAQCFQRPTADRSSDPLLSASLTCQLISLGQLVWSVELLG